MTCALSSARTQISLRIRTADQSIRLAVDLWIVKDLKLLHVDNEANRFLQNYWSDAKEDFEADRNRYETWNGA